MVNSLETMRYLKGLDEEDKTLLSWIMRELKIDCFEEAFEVVLAIHELEGDMDSIKELARVVYDYPPRK